MIDVLLLGQVGCRFRFDDLVVYVDPYLTDSVAEDFGEAFRRIKPAPMLPGEVRDADWVLITHEHQDHCDLATLVPLLESSRNAKVLAPARVVAKMADAGVPSSRLETARLGQAVFLSDRVTVQTVASAHPEVELDAQGQSAFVGWLVQYEGHRIYHAGDTALTARYLEAVERIAPVDTAFLPVNETNFFRTRAGIVGNMSLREAFGLAEILQAKRVVPLHWDLFASNSVFDEEIELVHRMGGYAFELVLDPKGIP
ncbi:MAG: MBL fold metallo-hydrolase [Fibrobacterota bacterium]|nr:MAG: MBL fold metallo-hydrolase [Fibrobacterota bacterium]